MLTPGPRAGAGPLTQGSRASTGLLAPGETCRFRLVKVL